MVNPVTPFQFPKNSSPVEPIAERLQRWSKLAQQLSEYTNQLSEFNRSNSASHEKLMSLVGSSSVKPESDAVLTEIPSALNKLHSDLKLASSKSANGLLNLSRKFQQISSDAQSRAENVRTYSSHFSSASSVQTSQKQSQAELEKYQTALKNNDHSQDLYLLKSRLDRSLHEHVSQENKLLENYHTVQSLGAKYDSAIVAELRSAIKDMDSHYKVTGKVLLEFCKGVQEYVFKVNSEEEYDEFLVNNKSYFITDDVPARDVANIQYEGQYSTASKLVRKGTLERRTKYLRSFVPAEYILTLTTLYELKDGQRTLAIDLSDATLETDHKHATDDKFVLNARQQGSSSGKHHTWVFRSDDAKAWASDLGKITKAAPGQRGVAVFGSETYEPEAAATSAGTGAVADTTATAAAPAYTNTTTSQNAEMPKSVDPSQTPSDTASTAAVASAGNSAKGVPVAATAAAGGVAGGAAGAALSEKYAEPGAFAGEQPVYESSNPQGAAPTHAVISESSNTPAYSGELPSGATTGAPVSTSGDAVIGGSSSKNLPSTTVDAPVGGLGSSGVSSGEAALGGAALGGLGGAALGKSASSNKPETESTTAFGEVPTTKDSSAIPNDLTSVSATDKSQGVSALDGEPAPVAQTQSRKLSTALDESPATETGIAGGDGLLSENSIAHSNEPAAKLTGDYPRKGSAVSPLDHSPSDAGAGTAAGIGAGAGAATGAGVAYADSSNKSGVPPIVTTTSSNYDDDSASDISDVEVSHSPTVEKSAPPAHSAAWQAQQDLAAFERKQSESAVADGDASSTFSYDKKHRASTYTGEDFKPPGSDLAPHVERKLTQTYHKYETVDPSQGLARTENETAEDTKEKMQRRRSSVSIKRSASRKATASYGGDDGLKPLSAQEKTQTGSAKLFFGDDLPSTTSGQ